MTLNLRVRPHCDINKEECRWNWILIGALAFNLLVWLIFLHFIGVL